MHRYLLKRLLLIPPTLFGILLIGFLMTRFVPGGPVDQAIEMRQTAALQSSSRSTSNGASGSLSKEDIGRMKEIYGLDRPEVTAFFEWLGAKPREVHPKSPVTFQPSEFGEKTALLTAQITTDNGAAPLLFTAEAKLTLAKDWSVSLTPPSDLEARIAKWADEQNPPTTLGKSGDAAKDPAAFRKKIREEALEKMTGWNARLVRPEVASPTPFQRLRGLFFASDADPEAEKPVRVITARSAFSGVLQGDFGDSFAHSKPALDVILSKLPVSAIFGIASTLLLYGIAIPTGVLKAVRHGGPFDTLSSFIVFALYAIPGFVIGILLLFTFAIRLKLFPAGGYHGDDFETLGVFGRGLDVAKHMLLPVIAMSVGQFAFMTMLMKNSLMDHLASDYVRTAVAKGVPFGKAVLRHAFRNSLVPLATSFGDNLAVIFTGSLLIERIFDIDGFGLLTFNALVGRDYPVFLANLLIGSTLLLAGNIISDICVALVDPRIRFEK